MSRTTLSAASTIVVLLPLLLPTPAHPQGTRFLRQPDVGATHIVFTHANDLWKVARDGGDAVRLTSSEAPRPTRPSAPTGAGSPSPASTTATPTST